VSDLVFGSLRCTAEVDMVPDTLVNEVHADLENHIQQAGPERERTLPGKRIENKGCRRAAENSVANRLDDTPRMAFCVSHCLPIVLYPMGITVMPNGRYSGAGGTVAAIPHCSDTRPLISLIRLSD